MNLTREEYNELVEINRRDIQVGIRLSGSVERDSLKNKGLLTIDMRPGIGKFWTLTPLGLRALNKHVIVGEGEV